MQTSQGQARSLKTFHGTHKIFDLHTKSLVDLYVMISVYLASYNEQIHYTCLMKKEYNILLLFIYYYYYYYCYIDRRISLNLSKSTQSATGLKALLPMGAT